MIKTDLFTCAMCGVLLMILTCELAPGRMAQQPRRAANKRVGPPGSGTKPAVTAPMSEERLKAAIDQAITLPLSERVERLKSLANVRVINETRAALKTRAVELLVSSRAALGDERLKAGDAKGGVRQFRAAINEAPAGMSSKLFVEVVSRFPANLFVRGQREEAVRAAKLIEAKVKDDPARLLALAAFYVSIEDDPEATRIAELAVKLAPELPAAHQALGAAHHIAFRLDEAAAAYARALELDPSRVAARRSLADLRRATGKPDEALTLYRELLAAEPADPAAQAGVVLSLFDGGHREEAERELQKALQAEPRNLPLLVGAAYWYATHNDGARALDLARRAVELEPRYTWGQIALARSLLKEDRALEAERALRLARQYGSFPTLSYELANVLAHLGLYEEAVAELAASFTIKDALINTKLGGRVPAAASNFIELLAPERRAGIFQPEAADTEDSARVLKGLLAFHSAMNGAGGSEAVKQTDLVTAANEFTAGDDGMRVFRLLYVAGRLLSRGLALDEVIKFAEAATSSPVEQAVAARSATVAVLADELQDIRRRAIAAGATPEIPAAPPRVLSSIVRGRIEDTIGWALFNSGKAEDAVPRLRRATGVLPENSLWWRAAQWHLGAALEASGNPSEALAAYIKGYNKQAPDLARRTIIEALYRKVKGSLDGLDQQIGPPAPAAVKRSAIAPATQSP